MTLSIMIMKQLNSKIYYDGGNKKMGKYIQKIMRQWKKESGSDRVCQFKLQRDGKLVLYTSQPGRFIGLHGCLYDKYESILKTKIPEINSIDIVETNWYWV